MPPAASVILCVRNGADTIVQQLDSLASQRVEAPWELLVVDNASTDATPTVVQRWLAHASIDGRVVDGEHARNLADARNVGAAAARGRVLCFCDADDEADPGWLAGLLDAAAASGLVGGALDVARLNSAATLRWQARVRPDMTRGLQTLPDGTPFPIGANMAVAADLYAELGGCDPGLPAWEEIDLAFRASRLGHPASFAPLATMHYRLRPSVRSSLGQVRHYARGEVAFRRRHPTALAPVRPRREARLALRDVRGALRERPSGLKTIAAILAAKLSYRAWLCWETAGRSRSGS
jgi:glycosyltransferase involved in cell wall biosynthesis